MERNLVRATVVIGIRPVPGERFVMPGPEDILGEGAQAVLGTDEFVFAAGKEDQFGLRNEVRWTKDRLFVGSCNPNTLPEILEKLSHCFGAGKGLELVGGLAYLAEHEWFLKESPALVWISDSFLKEDIVKKHKALAGKIMLHLSSNGDGRPPSTVSFEPRAGKDDAVFTQAIHSVNGPPEQLDQFAADVIGFCAQAEHFVLEFFSSSK